MHTCRCHCRILSTAFGSPVLEFRESIVGSSYIVFQSKNHVVKKKFRKSLPQVSPFSVRNNVDSSSAVALNTCHCLCNLM